MKCAAFILLLIAVLLHSPMPASGQEWDNELWTGIFVEKELHPLLELELEQQVRLDYNMSQFQRSLSQLSLSFKPLYFLRISGEYRVNFRYAGRFTQRVAAELSLRYRRLPFYFIYRAKLQRRYEKAELPQNEIRNKVEFRYRINRQWRPYFAAEIFNRVQTEQSFTDKIRFTGGLRWNIREQQQIRLFYRYEQDIFFNEPLRVNILGLQYGLSYD